MLDRTGKPNHLNMRRNKGEEFMLELQHQRRQRFTEWEREWFDDGTIPALGLAYVAIRDDGTEREYPDFASAMLDVLPIGFDKPRGRVDYITPAHWKHGLTVADMEAMQAEYRDERDTQRTLLAY